MFFFYIIRDACFQSLKASKKYNTGIQKFVFPDCLQSYCFLLVCLYSLQMKQSQNIVDESQESKRQNDMILYTTKIWHCTILNVVLQYNHIYGAIVYNKIYNAALHCNRPAQG